MRRVASSLLLALLVVGGAPALAPVLSRSVAYAEVSEEELREQLLKIKDMVADLEGRLKARAGQITPRECERMMGMLNEIERLLRDSGAYRSN